MTPRIVIGVVAGALALTAAGVFGAVHYDSASAFRSAGVTPLAVPPRSGADLQTQIASLRARVERVPNDAGGWAALGLAYVQQARITADPRLYDAAESALARSSRTQPDDNFAADAGRAALAAARHDFTGAKRWADHGLVINPHSALLYGALADAQVQLGLYDAAYLSTQAMVDRSPDTSSLARVSYTWELRGNVDLARTYMRRALDDAPTAADRAFARYYLAELAYDNGDPTTALGHIAAGLRDDPSYTALYQGRAKAEAALGRVDAALTDYAKAVERQPQPTWLLEYGELLEAGGDVDAARIQYKVFEAEQRLFAANGVALDVDAARYEADHGDPARALTIAEAGVHTRPFFEMQDTYAWALHVNGRDREALEWSTKARSLGTRNALLAYHAGMIEHSLGDDAAAARDLRLALDINPHFHPIHARTAQATLAQLAAR